MRSITSLLAFSAFASQASAHYIFQQLSVGSTKYDAFQFVRQGTTYNSPVTDLTSTDLRCNFGGVASKGTATTTVKAGDAFTFTSDVAVYHNGPTAIYMAKAPGAAADFDGSGVVWFKILDIGPDFSSGQAVWDLSTTYSYTIPTALPSGDYLLRIHQLGLHNPYPAGIPQFYISCAQITVTGGGSGTPGPLIAIPSDEFAKGDEPGYIVNIYNSFTSYTPLGPAVWSGQSGGAAPAPTTSGAVTKPTTTVAVVPTTTAAPTPTGAVVAKYGQCGGKGWSGATACVSGTACSVVSEYYSQCL